MPAIPVWGRGEWEIRGEENGKPGERRMGNQGRGEWETRGEENGKSGKRRMGHQGRGEWGTRGEENGAPGERRMGNQGRVEWRTRGEENVEPTCSSISLAFVYLSHSNLNASPKLILSCVLESCIQCKHLESGCITGAIVGGS